MIVSANRTMPKKSRSLHLFGALIFCVAALMFSAPSQSATQVDVTYTNDGFTAQVQLTSLIELEVAVRFEDAIGVSAENFDLNFQLVSPLNTGVVNRLPGTLVTLPTDFPVLISIQPKTDRGFSFAGVAEIEVYTKNLHYVPGSPLRLFHSSNGEQFKDITVTTGAGSYRARGNMGTFSDFLIVADLRSPTAVISQKVSTLADYLQAQSTTIDSPTYNLLAAAMSTLQSQVSNGNYAGAQSTVNSFISILETADGAAMPSIWRSSRDLENVSGTLLAQARSLRYSLRIL